jgi:transposase
MRPTGSPDLIADRRRRALNLLDNGFSLNAVARQIGCAPSSVMRWRDLRAKSSDGVFKVHLPPGRPSRLAARQLRKLERILLKGPLAFGYSTDLWTTQRIVKVIESEFGVSYHRDHIGRMMKKLGWSHQKPDRRAIERDDERIRKWKDEDWPRVKKTPNGWAPTSSS